MTITNGDPFEVALRSIIQRAMFEGQERIRLEEDGAKALEGLIERIVQTTHRSRGLVPMEFRDVQTALLELEARLAPLVLDLGVRTEGIVGRREVEFVANEICPLPPLCKEPRRRRRNG
jgi:hypothetical protein